MSEELNAGAGQTVSGQSEFVAPVETSEAISTPETAVEQDEPKLPQSQVNAIVSRETKRVKAEYEARIAQMSNQSQSVQPPQGQQHDIGQQVRDEVQRTLYTNNINAFVNNFEAKLQTLRIKDATFGEAYDSLNIPNVAPELAYHFDKLDNMGDVIKEFADKPTKYVDMINLSRINPALLEKELKKLSLSIKGNQEAPTRAASAPKAPLDQLKPSTLSTGGGRVPVSELRRRLKGL